MPAPREMLPRARGSGRGDRKRDRQILLPADQVSLSWQALRLDIESHDLSLLSGELHPDQVNRLAGSSVLVSIAAGLDLLQRLPLRQLFHHLELEQVKVAEGRHGHVDPAMVAGVFYGDIETQCGEVAVEDAGVVTFIFCNRVIAVPVDRKSVV